MNKKILFPEKDLTTDYTNSLNLLKRSIGNENNASFSVVEDWFSLRALMELAIVEKNSNPAQQVVLEDLATFILMKLLDYANRSVLKNFKLSLQQEEFSIGRESNVRNLRF